MNKNNRELHGTNEELLFYSNFNITVQTDAVGELHIDSTAKEGGEHGAKLHSHSFIF